MNQQNKLLFLLIYKGFVWRKKISKKRFNELSIITFFLLKYFMRDKNIMYMETLLGYKRKIRVHDRNKDWFSGLCERQFDLNIVTQLKDDFRVKRNFF